MLAPSRICVRITFRGAAIDSTKGLFNADLMNSDLARVFDVGLRDAAPFTENANFYYEKTFNCAGVGRSSANSGGGPATRITLVISKYGDVITMYPV